MGRLNGLQTKFSLFNFPETKLSDPMVSTRKKAYACKSSTAQISFTWFNSVLNIMGGKMSTVLKLATCIAAHVSLLLSEFFLYTNSFYFDIYINLSLVRIRSGQQVDRDRSVNRKTIFGRS